jgi:hypothetical protein
MIEVNQINDKYHVGREKSGGKVYVMGMNDAVIASYSGITETVEWQQHVGSEDETLITAYLKEHY